MGRRHIPRFFCVEDCVFWVLDTVVGTACISSSHGLNRANLPFLLAPTLQASLEALRGALRMFTPPTLQAPHAPAMPSPRHWMFPLQPVRWR